MDVCAHTIMRINSFAEQMFYGLKQLNYWIQRVDMGTPQAQNEKEGGGGTY